MPKFEKPTTPPPPTALWEKRVADVTVTDSLKVQAFGAVIMAAAPVLLLAGSNGVKAAYYKIRGRKKVKDEPPASTQVIETTCKEKAE